MALSGSQKTRLRLSTFGVGISTTSGIDFEVGYADTANASDLSINATVDYVVNLFDDLTAGTFGIDEEFSAAQEANALEATVALSQDTADVHLQANALEVTIALSQGDADAQISFAPSYTIVSTLYPQYFSDTAVNSAATGIGSATVTTVAIRDSFS